MCAHEPRHTVFTDPLALGLKGRVHPRAAVNPSRLGVDDPNLSDEELDHEFHDKYRVTQPASRSPISSNRGP